MRQKIKDENLSHEEDSHASIAAYFLPESKLPEDRVNKYEFNPFTRKFKVDQLNAKDEEGFVLDDSARIQALCRKLDFTTVVPNWPYVEEIYKKLAAYVPIQPITAEEMPPLEQIKPILAQVWAQVGDQVGDQVWICAHYAIKTFMGLDYDHPAFDLIRLGIMAINVLGKFKVFGKAGKFLGEFDE